MKGPHAHSVFVLAKSVTVGRAAATDIQILDQRVSRQHARLMLHTDGVVLIDLSSANGTYVHGHRIHRRKLQSGDRIQIGVSEYVYEETYGDFETSPRFLSKLTTQATMGATIVRKVANEILGSPTAEMPEAELASVLGAPPSPAPRPSDRPTRDSPTAIVSAGQVAVSQTPTREAPRPATHLASEPVVERPRTPTTIPFAPRDPSLLSPAELAGFQTEPLDPRRHAPTGPVESKPRTQEDLPAIDEDAPTAANRPTPRDPPSVSRSPTPVVAVAPLAAPEPVPAPAPAPDDAWEDEEDDGAEPLTDDAAQHAVDAVLKLLALRAKEARGARLRVQEREGIRRLEAALRSPKGSGNRRRWARLPCKLTARLGDGATSSAHVSDIGAGGISIEGADLPIAPGDEVTIRVALGVDRVSRTAVFHIRVVWVDAIQGSFGAVFAGPASWEMTA